MQAVKRILHSVKGTIYYGIRILSQSSLRLYGFVMLIRQVVLTREGQPTVSCSSVEAEHCSILLQHQN